MANMFNEDGTYNKTEWKAGDRITAVKLNKIELSLEAINNNDIDRHVEADSRLDVLEERMTNTPDNDRIDALEDMVKDNKDAAELGVYEIKSRITFLENELNEGIEEVHNVAETVDDMGTMVAYVEADLEGLHAKGEELSERLADNVNHLISGKFPIDDKLKGASIYLPLPTGQPPINDILDKLVYVNCNTVTICPIFWMNSSTSNSIDGYKGNLNIQEIKEVLIKAKEKGLKTIIKPHVGGDGFTSWSSINPSNIELWIANYSNFYISMCNEIVDYIDIFCITNELKGQTNQHKDLWVNLIDSLKSKKNIAVINAMTISESETNVFLDKLDYIGFNMYCPVEGDMSTDINQQTKSIFRLKPYINDMYNTMNKYNKKVIITEVGILPFEISLNNPEAWGFETEPPTNYEVQNRYYNIALKEFLYANNVIGTMIWNACDGFTFINRPAQEVVKKIYGGDI